MNRNLRLGIFLIAGLAVLTAGIFLIGRQESRFTSHYRVHTKFKNVEGLIEGAEVRVGGVHRGAVRSIALPKSVDGQVNLQIDLENETKAVVKSDSVVAIKSDGLLGDKFVEVGFGTDAGKDVQNDTWLASREPADVSAVMEKTDKLLGTAESALSNIRDATGEIGAIAEKVNQGKGTLGSLVNDKSIYTQAKAGVTALREDAQALQHNFFLRGFFKERGYDSMDDLTAHEVGSVPPAQPVRMFRFRSNDLFDKPTSAKLKDEKRLREAGQTLEGTPFKEVVIAASTGAKGDSNESMELARARAYVVRKALVMNFKVDDQRIKTIGLGKNEAGSDEVDIRVY